MSSMSRISLTWIPVALAVLGSSGCAGTKMSSPQNLRPLPELVTTLALAPSGGVLADAIGTELFNQGVQVIDTQQMSNYMVRWNLDEIELLQPTNLSTMREDGISAFLTVRTVAGYDDKPQSAAVRVVSTLNGELIAAVSWQNGRGGARGSPADAMMRKDIVGAAEEIGKSLASQLQRR